MKPLIYIILLILCSSLDYEDQAHWPDYCPNGQYQSPIDIPDESKIEYDSEYNNQRVIIEEINYTPIEKTKVGYVNDFSLSTKTLDNGGIKVRINGTLYSYKVQNIHFHLNSEHTINKKNYSMEMHIVHKNEYEDEINQFLVMAFIFEIGSENAFLNEIGLGTNKEVENVKINNIVKNETVYYYKGSLTTPPCSENVNWIVFKDIKTMSQTQFNNFKEFVGSVNEKYMEIGNNRTTLPLNGRKVYISEPNKESSDENSSFLKNKLSWILLLIALFY